MNKWLLKPVQKTVIAVQRRSKYLILQTEIGFLLSHLGMSGHWTIVDKNKPLLKHDHIQIDFTDFCLRYNDARRFGSFQWQLGKAEDYAGFDVFRGRAYRKTPISLMALMQVI